MAQEVYGKPGELMQVFSRRGDYGPDVPLWEMGFNPVGAHNADSSGSVARTLLPVAGATKVLLQATTQNIRFTIGNTTPTATVGFRLTAGEVPLVVPLSPNTVIQWIQETATATLQSQFGQ